jgi:hypothetical protein
MEWRRHHLYLIYSTGRRYYAGSIVRNFPRRTWAAWNRQHEYLGSFSDEDGARERLEENARDRE